MKWIFFPSEIQEWNSLCLLLAPLVLDNLEIPGIKIKFCNIKQKNTHKTVTADPWKCSRLGWLGLGEIWNMGSISAHGMG